MSDIENEVVENEQVEQAQIEQVDPAEAKARAKGWVDLEEWKEQGKDANDWAPYKFFNEKGDMISQIQNLKKQTKEFDARLSQNNEVWKAQLEMQKQALMSQRNEAIELADVSKVNELDKQIAGVDKQQAELTIPVVPQVDPADIAIENQYFNTLTSKPKQLYANSVAAQYVAQGLTGQALVDAVDQEMQKEFPPSNPRRESASVTDSVKKQTSKKTEFSTDNLSKEDKMMLNSMKSFPSFKGKSDAEILKAIEDSKR